MTPAKLTPVQRKSIYLILFALNAGFIALEQASLLPPSVSGIAGLVSFGLAALMKRFGSEETPAIGGVQ